MIYQLINYVLIYLFILLKIYKPLFILYNNIIFSEGLGGCMLVACRFWYFVLFKALQWFRCTPVLPPSAGKSACWGGAPHLNKILSHAHAAGGFSAVSPTTTQGSREGVSVMLIKKSGEIGGNASNGFFLRPPQGGSQVGWGTPRYAGHHLKRETSQMVQVPPGQPKFEKAGRSS